MAKFYELNVYHAASQLYLSLNKHTEKMPKKYWYAHIPGILQKIEEIMVVISFANNTKDKSSVLIPAIHDVERLQITLRNFYEVKIISKKGFASLAEASEKLLRQLRGWSNKYSGLSTEKTLESNNNAY